MCNRWRNVRGVIDELTCVYPQMDFQVMGGAEGLATVGAVFGGRGQTPLTNLGWWWLNACCWFPHVLPNIWSKHRGSTRRVVGVGVGGDKWKVCWVPLQTSPSHITTQFLCRLSVCHCPSFSVLDVQMLYKHIKRVHGPSYFSPWQNADSS